VSREGFEPEDHPSRPLPPRLDPRAGRPTRSRVGDASAPSLAPRQRTRRWALVARVVGAVLSLALLATSGWGWYLGQVADASVNRTDAIPTNGNDDASHTGADMNLLLVGQDGRQDLTPEQLAELNAGATDSGGLNTDTMILVHVPADGSRASFVSFPRDSYVQIPGHGSDKLNAAYAYGYTSAGSNADTSQKQAAGAQLLVQTISKLSGLQIDHYAEVDLLGFFNLATVVGGVDVNLCYAVDDRQYSGAVFPAGKQTISGADALKFVRERHGVRPDGSPALPRGDLDRIVRQQAFLASLAHQVLSAGTLANPSALSGLITAVSHYVVLDKGWDLLKFAAQARGLTGGNIAFRTIPTGTSALDTPSDGVAVQVDPTLVRQFFAGLAADGQAPAADPAAAPLIADVSNASGHTGLAAAVQSLLDDGGVAPGALGNAPTAARSVIRAAPADQARAQQIAELLGGIPVQPDATVPAGHVQVLLGRDYHGPATAGSTQQAGGGSAPAPAAGDDAPGAPPAQDPPITAGGVPCIN
jgi:LCP family protein required for cell wall assembly